MSVLDKLAAWLDRREVIALRREKAQLLASVARLEKENRALTEQVGNANLRVSQTTNSNLALKKRLRDAGVQHEDLMA